MPTKKTEGSKRRSTSLNKIGRHRVTGSSAGLYYLQTHCWRGHLMAEHRRRHKSGKPYCGKCKKIYDVRWKKANRDKQQKYWFKGNLYRNCGINIWDYEYMVFSQGGGCGICGTVNFGAHRRGGIYTKRGAVDHDHKTNLIRGILCDKCNRGIGLLGDSVEMLASALEYLSKPHEQRMLEWRSAIKKLVSQPE